MSKHRKNKLKQNYHVLPLLALVFVLSWQFWGSDSSFLYEQQNQFQYRTSSFSEGPVVRVQSFNAPQFKPNVDTGPFIVQIPQPAAPYIGPTNYPSLIASVIDWGWGPVSVDNSIAPAWVDYFHNRDYNRYYGNRQQQIVKKKPMTYRTYTQDIFANYKTCVENGNVITCSRSAADP